MMNTGFQDSVISGEKEGKRMEKTCFGASLNIF